MIAPPSEAFDEVGALRGTKSSEGDPAGNLDFIVRAI